MPPIFAVSDAVWLGVIGVIAMIVKEILDDRRASRAEKKVDKVAVDLETVHKATNSLTDKLVAASALAGEQKGAQDERAREAIRTGPPPVLESPTPGALK